MSTVRPFKWLLTLAWTRVLPLEMVKVNTKPLPRTKEKQFIVIMIKQCIIVIILTCYFELVVVYSRGSFDILLIYIGYYQWNQMWETHTNVFLNCYQ